MLTREFWALRLAENSDYQTYAEGAQERANYIADKLHSALVGFVSWTSSITADQWIAVATFLLAWIVYRQIVTSRAQLRAYVFPHHAKVVNFDANPVVQILFKNAGQTPAFKMDIWANCAAAIYPLVDEPEAPAGPATQSRGDIGPGMDFHVIAPCDPPLTAVERAGIIAGTAALYLYGRLNYRDAVGVSRFTKFCFMYGGAAGRHPEGNMATYKYWNEAN